MNFILDIIILAVIIITALLSARRGFVRTVIEVAGFIAAIFIASSLSVPLSSATYRSLIEKPLVSAVSTSADSSAQGITESVWDALPGFVTDNAEKFGFSRETLAQKLGDNIGNGAENAVQTAADSLVKPAVTRLLGGLYFALLFIVLTFVVRFLARLINKMFSFSLVGSLNRALGGVIGAVKGMIFAFVLCAVILLAVRINGGSLWFINDAVISNSILFRFFAGFTSLYPLK